MASCYTASDAAMPPPPVFVKENSPPQGQLPPSRQSAQSTHPKTKVKLFDDATGEKVVSQTAKAKLTEIAKKVMPDIAQLQDDQIDAVVDTYVNNRTEHAYDSPDDMREWRRLYTTVLRKKVDLLRSRSGVQKMQKRRPAPRKNKQQVSIDVEDITRNAERDTGKRFALDEIIFLRHHDDDDEYQSMEHIPIDHLQMDNNDYDDFSSVLGMNAANEFRMSDLEFDFDDVASLLS